MLSATDSGTPRRKQKRTFNLSISVLHSSSWQTFSVDVRPAGPPGNKLPCIYNTTCELPRLPHTWMVQSSTHEPGACTTQARGDDGPPETDDRSDWHRSRWRRAGRRRTRLESHSTRRRGRRTRTRLGSSCLCPARPAPCTSPSPSHRPCTHLRSLRLQTQSRNH